MVLFLFVTLLPTAYSKLSTAPHANSHCCWSTLLTQPLFSPTLRSSSYLHHAFMLEYSQNFDTCFALYSGQHCGDHDGQRRVPLTNPEVKLAMAGRQKKKSTGS